MPLRQSSRAIYQLRPIAGSLIPRPASHAASRHQGLHHKAAWRLARAGRHHHRSAAAGDSGGVLPKPPRYIQQDPRGLLGQRLESGLPERGVVSRLRLHGPTCELRLRVRLLHHRLVVAVRDHSVERVTSRPREKLPAGLQQTWLEFIRWTTDCVSSFSPQRSGDERGPALHHTVVAARQRGWVGVLTVSSQGWSRRWPSRPPEHWSPLPRRRSRSRSDRGARMTRGHTRSRQTQQQSGACLRFNHTRTPSGSGRTNAPPKAEPSHPQPRPGRTRKYCLTSWVLEYPVPSLHAAIALL